MDALTRALKMYANLSHQDRQRFLQAILPSSPSRQWITLAAAAKILGKHKSNVSRQIAAGRLRAIGGHYDKRVWIFDVRRWKVRRQLGPMESNDRWGRRYSAQGWSAATPKSIVALRRELREIDAEEARVLVASPLRFPV